MYKYLVFLLLIFGTESASSHTLEFMEINVTPKNPIATDVIKVEVWLFGGPFIETHSHTIDSNLVNINLVQDGLDLSPNPPVLFVEKVGPLPEGSYEFIVEVKAYYHNETHVATESFDIAVSPSFAPIPSGSNISILVLIMLIGVVALWSHITNRSSAFRQQAGSIGRGSA